MSSHTSYEVRFTTNTGDGGTIRFSTIERDMFAEGMHRDMNVKYGRSLYGQPNPIEGGTGTVVKVELLTRTHSSTAEVIEP